MYYNKYITLTLFVSLWITIIFIFIKWLFDIFIIKINNNKNNNENFNNKRNTKIKIYKSNEIFDPDEQPEIEDYDADDYPIKFDPDQ
jgi:hypothetical protein